MGEENISQKPILKNMNERKDYLTEKLNQIGLIR